MDPQPNRSVGRWGIKACSQSQNDDGTAKAAEILSLNQQQQQQQLLSLLVSSCSCFFYRMFLSQLFIFSRLFSSWKKKKRTNEGGREQERETNKEVREETSGKRNLFCVPFFKSYITDRSLCFKPCKGDCCRRIHLTAALLYYTSCSCEEI